MKPILIIFWCLCVLLASSLHAQMMPSPTANGPWSSNLMMRTSTDGNSFGEETKFIDSSGVPSLVKDSKGRILTAFQWFPAPRNSQYWDKVAVKISEDNGKTWGQAQPIVVNGLPSGFQRPFDPTLTLTTDGRIRIFFSSGRSMTGMLDSNVATYSAISTDGVNYTFESDVRFSVSGKIVIDPAVLRIGNKWYYTAPKGAPQEGAYHATSDDGLVFTRRGDIPSTMNYQWTGNLVEYGAGMRFYGSGNMGSWWSYATDGTSWSSPVNITTPGATMPQFIRAGDPTVLKIAENNYLIIYVSAPILQMTSVERDKDKVSGDNGLRVAPNPSSDVVTIHFSLQKPERVSLKIFNTLGQEVAQILDTEMQAGDHQQLVDTRRWALVNGTFFIQLTTQYSTLSTIPLQVMR